MTSLNLKLTDRISGWNQQQQCIPVSNNMLRVLQSKIMNSMRPVQNSKLRGNINIKSSNVRPSTVRVRPISPINQAYQDLLSHPTIQMHDNVQQQIRQQYSSSKFRNKSFGNNNNLRNRLKNKQNHTQKQQPQQKPKTSCLQIKRQQLIFNNYHSLRQKQSQKLMNNFHQMQIKLRKNRALNNKTTMLGGKQHQFQIIFQPNGKRTDIKIISCLDNVNKEKERQRDQNLFQVGIEKIKEGQYTKLTKNRKLSYRQKLHKNINLNLNLNVNTNKLVKKQKDMFTDTHFNQQQQNCF